MLDSFEMQADYRSGYFPNHEEIQRSYKSHPFHNQPEIKGSLFLPTATSMSDYDTPGSDVASRGHTSLLSPGFPPEVLQIPMGKYHPSNFKSNPTSSVGTPTGHSIPAPFPSHNLALPKTTGKRNTAARPGHERRGSDVKRKIQQYQREMIAQSRTAGHHSTGGAMKAALRKPNSPKLEPLGSPGPITPFELEESAGYMIAGGRAPTDSDVDRQRQNHLDMIEMMIDTEDRRARSPRTTV